MPPPYDLTSLELNFTGLGRSQACSGRAPGGLMNVALVGRAPYGFTRPARRR
jgi:hypothetical protein